MSRELLGDESRLKWHSTPCMSLHVLLDGDFRVGVVGPALFTPHSLTGDWAWLLMDDPQLEWGAEGSLAMAKQATEEAYLELLDFVGEWLPDNTLHIRSFEPRS